MTQSDINTIRAIIVDDEALARQGLALRLAEIAQVEVVQECANGEEAIAAIMEHAPDVVFLDIQMPGMTGFELIREIQSDILPMVIFVTAYDAFAIDAFNVHAVDYLLKPVEVDRLVAAIDKVKLNKAQQTVLGEKQRLMELVVSITGKSPAAIAELLDSDEELVEHADRLAIKDGSSITFVPVRDIDWIDAAGDYMCVHVKGATHIMRTTMKELEAKLDPQIFQRVHRSTIVNLERVEKVSSHINGEFHLTLSCGSSLKMSRSYKEKVKHFF
ncbi:MAG: two-component system LytT family response regulator [Pseudohongiellaceae bacterium]|jgi:two-component system LytT family response regulator